MPSYLSLPVSSRCPLSIRLATVALVLLSLAPAGLAQTEGLGNTTSTPVAGVPHDYITGLNEIVNPANGAVSVRIPQPYPHERNPNWPQYAFQYDSNLQASVQNTWTSVGCSDQTTCEVMNTMYYQNLPSSGGGYAITSLSACIQSSQNGCTNYQATVYSNFIQTDPTGGRHALGLQYCINNLPGSCGALGMASTYLQGGDEQYKAALNPTTYALSVVDLHGNSPQSGFQSISQPPYFGYSILLHEDVNGNYTNTTGRTASLIRPVPDTINSVTQTEQLSFTQSFNVNPITQGVGCQLTVNGQPENAITPSGSFTAVTGLTLPNAQTYTFSYDPTYKLLNQITYPTGATVTYTWSTIPNADGAQYKWAGVPGSGGGGGDEGGTCAIQHDWFAITKRVVSVNTVIGGAAIPVEEQDFSYTTCWPDTSCSPGGSPSYEWVSKNTTVTTKDLLRGTQFNTVYTYSPRVPPPSSVNAWVDQGVMPVENTITYYDTSGSLLKTVSKVWNSINQLSGECETLPNGQTSGKFYVYQSYNPANWSSLNPAATSTNLPTDVAEYDYTSSLGSGSGCVRPSPGTLLPTRETKTTYWVAPSPTPLFPGYPSLLDRPATVQVYGVASGSQALLQETDYSYDGTSPTGVTPTPYGHDETNYGSGSTAPRGNPTTVTKKCLTGCTTNSVTTYTYDTTGQRLSSKDANGNTTNYLYTDNYTTDDGSPSGNTNAYLTKITEPSTNGVAHVTTFQYGYEDGKLRNKTDENSRVTTYCYWTGGCSGSSFDPFVRLISVKYPDNGLSTFSYIDAGPSPSVTTTTGITSSLNLTSTTTYDAIGRPVQTALTSDPDGTSYAATTYDGMAKPWQVYNPTRCSTPTTNCGTETTWGFATYTYDALGRTTTVADPDGSVATTVYSNNQTTVTDEVGNQRTSQNDALGRLTYVWEAPAQYNYETDYAYDALNNLLSVTQKGGSTSGNWRTRSFIYDSLSRLTSATNPESGTITYAYDADGNVLTKTAPSPNQASTGTKTVVTTYAYDQLNRITERSYADSDTSNPPTANSSYGYDGVAIASTNCPENTPPALTDTYPVGRRTAMCDGSGATSWTHDQVGRLWSEKRIINGHTQTTSYAYNLDGSLATLTYPSTGKIVTYTVGGAGRPTAAQDTADSINYVESATYAPPGELTSAIFGNASGFNGMTVTNAYSDRLQPILLSATSPSGTLFSHCFDFHLRVSINTSPCSFSASTVGDNGNVYQIVNTTSTTRNQNFMYDPLNRIEQAYSSGTQWGETFGPAATSPGVAPLTPGIDAWGNLTNRSAVTGKTYYEPLDAPALTNNELTGYTYDPAGNMTNNSGSAYNYDAENRLVTAGGYNYYYDGDGNRVAKSNGSTGTLYWRGPTGDPISESSITGTSQEEYIFFDSTRIARRDVSGGAQHYYFSDHLGSHAVVENATGSSCEQDIDYYPYGGVVYDYCATVTQHYRFTGKERDTESGLDNFGARYFASTMGRFMTPDWAARPTAVPYAVFGDPQSLNLYTYVRNDPVSRADADGHCYRGYGIECGSHDGPGYLMDAMKSSMSSMSFPTGRDSAEYLALLAASTPGVQNQSTSGEGSQANVKRRDAIAGAAVDAKERADLGQKQYGPNQCSAFVAACISKAGAKAEFDDSGRPPVAGEWANKKANIPGWRVLAPDEKPAPGDVAAVHIQNPHFAATGDSAIVVQRGNGLSAIQAGDHGVEYNSNFIHGYEGVVYRRYTGD
jgi:RHS repeat-associated protein